jgi:hypothetical protein
MWTFPSPFAPWSCSLSCSFEAPEDSAISRSESPIATAVGSGLVKALLSFRLDRQPRIQPAYGQQRVLAEEPVPIRLGGLFVITIASLYEDAT